MEEDPMNYMSGLEITLDCNLARLKAMSELAKDWNGYNAEPIPSSVVATVEIILRALDIQPNIFPTGRESIQLEYDCNFNYLEIEVFESSTTMMFVPHSDETDCDGRTYDKACFYKCRNNKLDTDLLNFMVNIFCTES